MPVHLGSMPLSVKAAIESRDLGPGDMVILNDPYKGGTHLPDVTLVSGPVELRDHAGVTVVRVESARDMLHRVEAALPADIAIFAAAVADWRVATEGEQKLKKTAAGMPPLQLVENPDILATISKLKDKPNGLQLSKCMPSILQTLNLMLLKAVFVSFAMLKLQLKNSQSENLMSARLAFEKSQLEKIQCSYSPFASG